MYTESNVPIVSRELTDRIITRYGYGEDGPSNQLSDINGAIKSMNRENNNLILVINRFLDGINPNFYEQVVYNTYLMYHLLEEAGKEHGAYRGANGFTKSGIPIVTDDLVDKVYSESDITETGKSMRSSNISLVELLTGSFIFTSAEIGNPALELLLTVYGTMEEAGKNIKKNIVFL